MTPVAFTLAALPLILGRFRFGLFDVLLGLAPIARDSMVESMSDGLIALDNRDRIVDLNPAARRLIQPTPPNARSRSAPPTLPADLKDAVFSASASPSGQTEIAVGVGEARRDYVLVVSRLRARSGRTVGRLLDFRDVTDRKRADRALLEEEQRELAYELHDGLAQLVASAHLHLQAFAFQHPPGSTEAREDLDRVLGLAQDAVRETRRVIAGLRPTALDDFGLSAAIRMQVESMRADGWDLEYDEALGDHRLPPDVETALFRVTREAIANVRKHADSPRARVALHRQGSSVRLEVQDWGRGFDLPAVTSGRAPGERLGLRGMEYRVSMLGGTLRIEARPGAGTLIVAEIPLGGGPTVSATDKVERDRGDR